MAKVTTEEELTNAIKNNEDTIEIEGDLSKKAIRIKATGKVAWVVAIASTIVAVIGILLITTSGGKNLIALGSGTGAVSTLGSNTTIGAIIIAIAIAGAGIGILNKLRKYRIEKVSEKRIILHKK